MSLVELAYPTQHMVQGGHFDARVSRLRVQSLLDEHAAVVVIGPPALVDEVVRAGDGPLHGADRLTIVTAGGWKRHGGAAVDRARFVEQAVDGLGLGDRGAVRDAFNQVELNTVVMECGEGRKHVPPWLEVIVRDPRTLEPVADGQAGVLSYLDPTATSFPCFIVSDDLGTLRSGTCGCGVAGRTLSLTRRLERPEQMGCALKMDRDYATAAAA